MEQWYFRITKYAERLLDGHAQLEWPDDVILMQKHWIGKSQGVEFVWQVADHDESFRVFTTRPIRCSVSRLWCWHQSILW